MARKNRLWIPDYFYHIVCRGNRRDPLFDRESDFKIFLHILREVHQRTPFELAAYCLMTNHFHLQLRSKAQSISKVMSLINKRYADYYNTSKNLTGHVFEKRFYDQIVNTGEDMLETSRYIHMNPVEAGMVSRPEDYRWSSYRYYLHSLAYKPLFVEPILSILPGSNFEKRNAYIAFVNEERSEEQRRSGLYAELSSGK